ncbi:MAG TPA: hypothetical protein VGF34_14660 [Stellaceae bacterium]|jgi:hypothetical protein
MPLIARKVWRKGWRAEAAATQTASAAISGVIRWFEEQGFPDTADQVRRSAMQLGARKAEPQLSREIAAWARSLRKARLST